MVSATKRSAVELGQHINAQGGIGEYIATYAGIDALDDYDASARLRGLYRAAWQAMQNFIDAAEDEGIFG